MTIALSETLLARIGALNRAPLPEQAIAPADGSQLRPQPAPRRQDERPSARPIEVDLLSRGIVTANASGEHLRVVVPVCELWHECEAVVATIAGRGASPPGREPTHPEIDGLLASLPQQTLFLDLETCGFAGSPIFLIGMLRCENGGLIVEQLLARTYAEERSILDAMWHIAAAADVLVTFNGKSFDWPMVQDRSTRHHLGRVGRKQQRSSLRMERITAPPRSRTDPRPNPLHCDLLHHARRRWKTRLPDCKLQTLERFLCGRRRVDDLPGSLIPAAYHQFVRTAESEQMQAILKHNLLDLVTSLQIALRLLTPPRPAESSRG